MHSRLFHELHARKFKTLQMFTKPQMFTKHITDARIGANQCNEYTHAARNQHKNISHSYKPFLARRQHPNKSRAEENDIVVLHMYCHLPFTLVY